MVKWLHTRVVQLFSSFFFFKCGKSGLKMFRFCLFLFCCWFHYFIYLKWKLNQIPKKVIRIKPLDNVQLGCVHTCVCITMPFHFSGKKYLHWALFISLSLFFSCTYNSMPLQCVNVKSVFYSIANIFIYLCLYMDPCLCIGIR